MSQGHHDLGSFAAFFFFFPLIPFFKLGRQVIFKYNPSFGSVSSHPYFPMLLISSLKNM